jgi:hypothetical protein
MKVEQLSLRAWVGAKRRPMVAKQPRGATQEGWIASSQELLAMAKGRHARA